MGAIFMKLGRAPTILADLIGIVDFEFRISDLKEHFEIRIADFELRKAFRISDCGIRIKKEIENFSIIHDCFLVILLPV